MFYGQCWKCGERWSLGAASTCTCEPEQPQRTWVGLMRGVRVDGDTVVITVKGGNDAARELCGELVKEMGVRNGA